MPTAGTKAYVLANVIYVCAKQCTRMQLYTAVLWTDYVTPHRCSNWHTGCSLPGCRFEALPTSRHMHLPQNHALDGMKPVVAAALHVWQGLSDHWFC
jgi:hypothetical protein